MRIATIILNWNSAPDTLECLDSVIKAEMGAHDHEIVVVDNASTDGSADEIASRFPQVNLVRNPANQGFAGGVNRGFEWALEREADFVILLNNDAVIEPDAFSRMVEFAITEDNVGAVTPLIRYYDDEREVWHAGARVIRPFGRIQPFDQALSSRPHRVQVFTACCVLIPRGVLEQIGTFDERFFIYLEDTDLALRIHEAGYDTWLLPEATVYHKVSRSFGGDQSPNALYYAVRNNLLLIKERSAHGLERLCGYGYMAALSAKIFLNIVTRGLPQKQATASAVVQGWSDFMQSRWSQRQ